MSKCRESNSATEHLQLGIGLLSVRASARPRMLVMRWAFAGNERADDDTRAFGQEASPRDGEVGWNSWRG